MRNSALLLLSLLLFPSLASAASSGLFTASNLIIESSQYQTLTANVVGGQSPYTYNFLIYANNGLLEYNALYTGIASTQNVLTFQHLSAWGTGVFTANVYITDSATVNVVVSNQTVYYTPSAALVTMPPSSSLPTKVGQFGGFANQQTSYLSTYQMNQEGATNSMSFGIWFKLLSVPTTYAMIFTDTYSGTSRNGYDLWVGGAGSGAVGYLVLERFYNGNGFTLTSLGTLSMNQWYYATVTYNGLVLSLYLNGVLQSSSSGVTGAISVNEIMHLGGTNLHPGNQQLADFQVYSAALTPAQVNTLYNSGIGGNTIASLSGNLISYLPLNGNSVDFSGLNNNGVATGVVTYPSNVYRGYAPTVQQGLAASNTIVFTALSDSQMLPLTYNYIVFNTITHAIVANMLYTGVTLTSNTFSFTANTALEAVGSTLSANVQVTDANSFTTVSANVNTITVTGPAAVIQVTPPTNALPQSVAQFNGQSSYIQLPSTARQTGAFTFSFWVNPVSWMNNQYQSLFGGCGLCGGNSGGIALTNTTDAHLHFEIYNSINDQVLYITHANTPPTGSWSFITVSWDGTAGASAVKYYENGVLLQSGAGVLGPIVWGSYNLDIGARSAPKYWFDGSIADFQIYNTALSAAQVSTLYQSGIGGSPVASANIVGWWPLNGNATDYSGNNNAGVATNVIYNATYVSGYAPPASNTFFDVGQGMTFTAATNSLNPPFTYNYLIANSTTGAAVANMLYSSPFSSNSWYWAPMSKNTVVAKVIVTDANGVSSNSPVTGVEAVASAPSLSSPLPSNTVLDYGQSVTYNTILTGGIGPYTVNLMNNGVVANSITVPQVGQFNGHSSYVSVGTSSSLNVVNSITISAWIYTIQTSTIGQAIASTKTTEAGTSGFVTEYYSNQKNVQMYWGNGAGSGGGTISSSNVIANSWVHVVYALSGNTYTAYINGVSIGSYASTNSFTSASSNPLQIGKMGSGTYFFNGLISNIQVYNTALSATQITALYNEGIGGAPVLPSNDVLWMPLNGNANDLSGNGNNGVAYNILYGSPSPYTVTFGSNIPAQGSQTFYVVGNDLGTTQGAWGFNSLSNTIKVNVNPSAGIVPASASYDSGQTMTLTAIPSGGTLPYTYRWYNYTSGNGVLMGGQTANILSLTSGAAQTVSYFVGVTDAVAVSANSAAGTYVINGALVAGTPTASNSLIDAGQYSRMSPVTSGGTPGYSYKWYAGVGCTSQVGSGSTYLAQPSSTTTYYYQVTDSAYSPNTACSAIGVTVTVNPVPSAATTSLAIIFSSTWSGGIAPFTANLLSSLGLPCNKGSTLIESLATGTNAVTFNSITVTQSKYFCIYVTDASPSPITINSTTTFIQIGGPPSWPPPRIPVPTR